jgi:hypothetical protein
LLLGSAKTAKPAACRNTGKVDDKSVDWNDSHLRLCRSAQIDHGRLAGNDASARLGHNGRDAVNAGHIYVGRMWIDGVDSLRVGILRANLLDVYRRVSSLPDLGQTECRRGVDHARVHRQALAVDTLGAGRDRDISSDRRYLAVADDDGPILDHRA